MKKTFVRHVLALALGAGLVSTSLAADKTLKVGVTAGPHAQIMEVVKEEAAKKGYNIEIIEFSDYVQPNVALAAGDLDANSYQHLP